MTQRLHITTASLLLAAACVPLDQKVADDRPLGKTESYETIDTQNDPNRFRLDMTRRFSDLPVAGESTRKPFPSNWWPMSQGGIARRWNGSDLSPAEKYDQLFTPDAIREVQLTLAKQNWKDEPVNEDAQPETFHIGPAAEWELTHHGRYGETDPDTWWGHCNGWSSYVLNEDEPTRPVNVRWDAATSRVIECASATEAGCVRFELGDINALGAELYWHDAARMLGRRCEQEASEFTFDESGRINAVECRDGNAGAFHIIATNMLGRLTRPFIVDLTADFQVWNYPIYRFELTRNDPLTVEEALREVGAPAGTTTWTYNTDARAWRRIQLKAWIVEDAIPPSTAPAGPLLERYTSYEYYEYILELDANDTVIGGEWVGANKNAHPDFLWYSYSNSAYSATSDDQWDGDNTAIRYSWWKQILTLSQQPPPPPPPPSGDVLRVTMSPRAGIPDNDATGITSSLEVTESFTPAAARLAVDITHTYIGDLVITLEHGGQTQTVHNQAGGSADNLVATFDLTAFTTDARGTWTLRVSDRAGQDTGTLNTWTLDLTRPEQGGGGGNTEPLVVNASPGLAIPDNNTTGVTSAVEVTESFVASRVRVTVDITHTYRGDLRVSLIRGDRTITLHDRTGGSADNLSATFEAADVAGQDVRGTWTLAVADTARADTGTLRSWSLELSRPVEGGGGGGNSVSREYTQTLVVAIPDNDPAGAATTITVADDILIDTLNVEVNITHTYIGDLHVTLSNGTATATLHANTGGSADNIRRTFETSAFRSASMRGTWTVSVVDNAAQDVGTIDSVTLRVTGTSR